MKEKIVNFWYYNKTALLIAGVILAFGVYLLLQQSREVQPDYHIAVVSPLTYPDETLASLQAAVEASGEYCNGDGAVMARVHAFRIALGAENQDANQIGALDADLVGSVSGIFFLHDPKAFDTKPYIRKTVNGICIAQQAVPASGCRSLSSVGLDDLMLSVRRDADERYVRLFNALRAG